MGSGDFGLIITVLRYLAIYNLFVMLFFRLAHARHPSIKYLRDSN